jgi:micrococcal nuclease
MLNLIRIRNFAIISFWVIFTGSYAYQLFWLQSSQINTHKVLGATDPKVYYEVEKVVDGDTIRVNINGKSSLVRFIGINAPEIEHSENRAECFGYNSKLYLKKLLFYQRVRLESDPNDSNVDRYGRLLRYVFLENGQNLNEKMARDGYAFSVIYKKDNKYEKQLQTAQQSAQKDNVGYWAENICVKDPK